MALKELVYDENKVTLITKPKLKKIFEETIIEAVEEFCYRHEIEEDDKEIKKYAKGKTDQFFERLNKTGEVWKK